MALHVARMEEIRNAYENFVGKLEGYIRFPEMYM
jgi:hypothetical protein